MKNLLHTLTRTTILLAAPLLSTPFTNGHIGILMRKGQDDLLDFVNALIHRMQQDGSLHNLHEKYGFAYTHD